MKLTSAMAKRDEHKFYGENDAAENLAVSHSGWQDNSLARRSARQIDVTDFCCGHLN
jgi:hypothetical protein